MRRKSSGLRVLHLFWVACLFVPPAVRLWLDLSRAPFRGGEPLSGETSASLSTADLSLEAARGRLIQAESDLRALDVTLPGEEYKAVLARVLPMGDPSAGRSTLFVGVRSRSPVPIDITAVTVDHRLLGRVVDVLNPPLGSEGFAVARVQTLLDPSFRVRFVAGETRGLAGGSGETTDDARYVVLEIIWLEDPRELEEGETLYTDSAGGVFAPGIPIGSVTRDSRVVVAKRRNRLPLIRSEIVIPRQTQVVLLRDAMRPYTAQAREMEP